VNSNPNQINNLRIRPRAVAGFTYRHLLHWKRVDPGTTRPLAGWCLPTWWPRCCWRLGSRRSSGRSAERRR